MKTTTRETEEQNLSLEKLTTLPSTQDYANSICSTFRVDTADVRNILCRAGNSLMRIDQTMRKITSIVKRWTTKN